ncbi:MAG: hypothetical protein WDO24_28360 [Pseudomonadota bacterium]
MFVHRPSIAGTRHMISAGHYLAATAGSRSSRPAATRSMPAAPPVSRSAWSQPDIVNVAGVAPIMLYSAEKREVVTIAGLGGWPRSLDPTIFQREHAGHHAVRVCAAPLVPAAPDAWITALARYGTMRFGEVAAAATGSRATASSCIRSWPTTSRNGPRNIVAGRAVRRSICPTAGRPSRASCSSARPRGLAAIYGRPGAGGARATAWPGWKGGARRLLSR